MSFILCFEIFIFTSSASHGESTGTAFGFGSFLALCLSLQAREEQPAWLRCINMELFVTATREGVEDVNSLLDRWEAPYTTYDENRRTFRYVDRDAPVSNDMLVPMKHKRNTFKSPVLSLMNSVTPNE